MFSIEQRPGEFSSPPTRVSSLRPWRMNLLACSNKDPLLFFMAVDDKINVYSSASLLSGVEGVLVKCWSSPSTINALRIGSLNLKDEEGVENGEEVLLV